MRSIHSLTQLTGRKALITGGAGHIGSAIADALLECGADVILLDQHAPRIKEVVETLSQKYPGRVTGTALDISKESVLRKRVPPLIRDGLDILIHSAAFVATTKIPGWAVPFDSQSVSGWDAALRVNLTSAFVLSQICHPVLAQKSRGSIIFISSIYGMVGPDFSLYEGTDMINPAGYGASKGGLLQLTRHLSTLFAPKIRVNAISPGGIWRNQPKAFVKRYEARTPMKRMGTEEDLRGAAVFLSSDLSAYVTGHNLPVDGGWTSW